MCMSHFQHFSAVSNCISSAQQSHIDGCHLGQHRSKRKKTLDTPMFIAVWFTIVKTRKQLKCPLKDEWIKEMYYIYTMEDHSAIK